MAEKYWFESNSSKVLDAVLEALRDRFAPKEPLRHDYAKGVWFETFPQPNSITIDVAKLTEQGLFTLNGPPERMGEFVFEPLGGTEYRITKVPVDEASTWPRFAQKVGFGGTGVHYVL